MIQSGTVQVPGWPGTARAVSAGGTPRAPAL